MKYLSKMLNDHRLCRADYNKNYHSNTHGTKRDNLSGRLNLSQRKDMFNTWEGSYTTFSQRSTIIIAASP